MLDHGCWMVKGMLGECCVMHNLVKTNVLLMQTMKLISHMT